MIYKVLRKTGSNCRAILHIPSARIYRIAISLEPVLIPYERISRRIIV